MVCFFLTTCEKRLRLKCRQYRLKLMAPDVLRSEREGTPVAQ